MPISKWVDLKTVVHLHNGILHSRKEKGTSILRDSTDGTGECYATWNKLGCERQIPYDPTYKWNLINKTNTWAKQNQRHGNKEQTDSNQRGGARVITGKAGEGSSRNMYKGPMDKAKGGGLRMGGGGGWWRESGGGKWRQLYLNNNKKKKKSCQMQKELLKLCCCF